MQQLTSLLTCVHVCTEYTLKCLFDHGMQAIVKVALSCSFILNVEWSSDKNIVSVPDATCSLVELSVGKEMLETNPVQFSVSSPLSSWPLEEQRGMAWTLPIIVSLYKQELVIDQFRSLRESASRWNCWSYWTLQ